jgi:hypothetical protein
MHPRRIRILGPLVGSLVVAASAVATFVSSGPAQAATVTLPDMTIKVPNNLISIGIDPSTGHRQLRFTHITEDSGTGPFEIVPNYNSATGVATFSQYIYNSPSPGVWNFDHSVPVAQIGTFVSPSDYNFPLTSFTLHSLNSDGSLGPVVATSPKADYCITGDTRVGDVPNTPAQTFIPQSNCVDPTQPLGWSVGWGDQYDQTDSGQPIDINGLPDGAYVLRGVVDPKHVLSESNNTNNVTDTTLTITGNSVTVGSQTNPVVIPPSVTLTSPTNGGTVGGTATLQASAAAASSATITSVQFLLDGQPLGAPVTTAPYTFNWLVGATAPGPHTLSAQATDSAGNIGTAPGVNVTVTTGSGGGGPLSIDRSVSARGNSVLVSPPFSTTVANETLLAFVSSDGPAVSASQQIASVSGAGLTWQFVKGANVSNGDTEVWAAISPAVLSGVSVSATAAVAGYDGNITVVALRGAGGIGASQSASGPSGGPTVSLQTTQAGSLSFAAGNDWDTATGRTLGSGQTLVAQDLDGATGDTYWVQDTTATSTAAGQTVTLSDTLPIADQWNMAAVEVVPGSSGSTLPSVSISNPINGGSVSGTQPVAANATGGAAIASVQFYLDNQPLGAPVTAAPYAIQWNTTTTSNGPHTLTAVATDTANNSATSSPVTVTVQNPAPPMTCFVMQGPWSAHGTGTVTTPSFRTAAPGEVLLAFVSADGPASALSQSAKVSGGGLTWTLAKRSNAQYGDAEIWTATAQTVLSSATVKSSLTHNGYTQQLTVIAMEEAGGVGASQAASGGSGPASATVKTTSAASLVFAVGEDWDNDAPRTLPTGDVMLVQYLSTSTGDTMWSEYTNQTTGAAGSTVTIGTTGPVGDRWDLAAVELTNAG